MDRELAKTTSDINTFRSVLMEAECSIPESQLQQIDGLNKSLASVNEKLEQCVSKADQLDYLLAIASGILCGAIDSLYVGQLTVTADDIKLSHKQVNEFIEKYAKKKGWNGEGRLESAVKFLEDKYPVAQDNIFKGNIVSVSAKNHHLADMAHHPTPLGLVSAILVHFFRIGLFLNKDGEWHIKKIPTSSHDIVEIWTPVIISGLLNWLVNIAEYGYEFITDNEVPKVVHDISKLLASSPVIIEVIKVIDNWVGHLVSDVAGSKQTAGAGMGIPGVFLSLGYEFAGLPVLKNTGLAEALDNLYENKDFKFNFRKELPLYKNIAKQSIPVILNDVIVRTFFFIRALIREAETATSIKEIDWMKVLPVHDRTVDQMIAISSLTFSAADFADSAARAAIESSGNYLLTAGLLTTRLNYIGAGKAIISVAREISYEKQEQQLLQEKRLLAEAHSVLTVDVLTKYRQQLEFLVSQYIAESIETSLKGLALMDQGIQQNNSDLFIQGNVIIQNQFGRQAQFNNQQEFDQLMNEDEPLKL